MHYLYVILVMVLIMINETHSQKINGVLLNKRKVLDGHVVPCKEGRKDLREKKEKLEPLQLKKAQRSLYMVFSPYCISN